MPTGSFFRTNKVSVIVFAAAAALTFAAAALLVDVAGKKHEALSYPLKVVEIGKNEIDPVVWGKNFPFEYDTFVKTEIDYGETKYGGSKQFSRLDRYPALRRLYAGNAFAVDYNEERGHHYAAIDQANTKRVSVVQQPGACVNCHAAEAPLMIEEMGWAAFNRTPYDSLKGRAKTGSSCSDCHDPETMELRITRPAFRIAMEAAGVDLKKATRQEMRTWVCAQCHVEYYFKGEDKALTFPWSRGRSIDSIEVHYDEYAFKDFVHKETGAPMIKIQHPEFELWSTGIHAKAGVSCADCHMPYIREGSVKISDHWVRSPLVNLEQSCQTCHRLTKEELNERVVTIQDRTAALLRRSELAIVAAIDAIVAARAAGARDDALHEALRLHRAAQMRWDFISSENSTGFHSPQEAARVLAESIDLARQAQIAALEAASGGAAAR
jgi:nitrite reductase (cytochrome c-552)